MHSQYDEEDTHLFSHRCVSLAVRCMFLSAALTACASSTRTEPVVSLKEIRQRGVVIQQWDTSCAAAALATLLHYQYGVEVQEEVIAVDMLSATDPEKVKRRGGFSLLDLKKYVESAHGLRGIGYQKLALGDLLSLAPVIVPANFSGLPHFVVVRGTIGDKVLLADPSFGNRAVSTDHFLAAWLQPIGFIVAGPDGRVQPAGELAVQAEDFLEISNLELRDAIR